MFYLRFRAFRSLEHVQVASCTSAIRSFLTTTEHQLRPQRSVTGSPPALPLIWSPPPHKIVLSNPPGAHISSPAGSHPPRSGSVAASPPLQRGGMDGKTLHKHKNSMLTGEQDLGDFFQEHEPSGGSPERATSCIPEESALMSPGGRHGTTARRSFSRKSSATTLIPAEQCAPPPPPSPSRGQHAADALLPQPRFRVDGGGAEDRGLSALFRTLLTSCISLDAACLSPAAAGIAPILKLEIHSINCTSFHSKHASSVSGSWCMMSLLDIPV